MVVANHHINSQALGKIDFFNRLDPAVKGDDQRKVIITRELNPLVRKAVAL